MKFHHCQVYPLSVKERHLSVNDTLIFFLMTVNWSDFILKHHPWHYISPWPLLVCFKHSGIVLLLLKLAQITDCSFNTFVSQIVISLVWQLQSTSSLWVRTELTECVGINVRTLITDHNKHILELKPLKWMIENMHKQSQFCIHLTLKFWHCDIWAAGETIDFKCFLPVLFLFFLEQWMVKQVQKWVQNLCEGLKSCHELSPAGMKHPAGD